MSMTMITPCKRIGTILPTAFFLVLTLLMAVASTQAADIPGIGPPADLPSSPVPGTDGTPSCGAGGDSCAAKFDVGSSPSDEAQPGNSVGNPINLMTGNKYQSEVDFQISGAMLSLKRMYNSGNSDSNLGLGQGWYHSYSVSLFDSGNGRRQIVQSNGARLTFEEQGTDENGYPLYRSTRSHQGYLTFENKRHYWHLSDGRVLKFNGTFLVEIDWPDQRKLKLFYRSQRLHTVTDETGRVLRFAYSGNSQAEALPAYDKRRFGSAPGYLDSVTLPDGSVIGYDYDDRRNLTRVRFPDRTSREYHYEDENYQNHLTGLTDRTGVRFASWSYDDEGRAISSEHAGGVEKVTLQYPDLKAVESGEAVETIVTNSLGAQSVYTWQQAKAAAEPNLLGSEGAGCATCPETGYKYTYDEKGRLLSSLKIGQGRVTYNYDIQGRINKIRSVDAAGANHLIEQREYDQESQYPVRTVRPSVNPLGEHVTETHYDSRHRPVRVVERGYTPVFTAEDTSGVINGENNAALVTTTFEPIERQSTLTWENERLIAFDGPRTDVEDITHLEWDTQNRLVGILPPASPALRLSVFDELGRVTRYQLGTRTPFELSYNSESKVTQLRQGAKVLWLDYDKEQRLSKLRDEEGYSISLSHDEAGRVTSIIDELGRITRLSHDTESRIAHRTALGIDGTMIRAMKYLFDEQGTLTRSRDERAGGSLPSVQVLDYKRSLHGDALQVSDAATGESASTVVDRLAHLATLTRVDGSVTQVQFDMKGATTRVVDARGNTTLSPVDDFGRTVMQSSADTGRTLNQFDEAGNRTQMILADGASVRFIYDAANRRTARDDRTGLTSWQFDASNGLLIEAKNITSTEQFKYDDDGRLTHHKRLLDGHRFQTHYAYDTRGRLSEKGLPDGQQLHYHYYEEGPNKGSLRAITKRDWRGMFKEQTLVAEIDLERGDGEAGYLSGNGVRTREKIAANGELTRLEIGGTLAFGYQFDAAGRIVRIDQDEPDGRHSTTYDYDYGRLTKAYNSTFGTHSWRYDVLGNRIMQKLQTPQGDTQISTYDYPKTGQGNRLLSVHESKVQTITDQQASDHTTDYVYNRAGAPKHVGALNYSYDNWQRPLIVRRNGELLAEYAYNAFGERVKKTRYESDKVPQVTYYLYDENAVTSEANAKSEIIQQYVYLEGHRPVALLRGQKSYAIHADHRGAARQVTDQRGQVVWKADYQAFGEALIDPDSTLNLSLRLPGQYADAETRTYYNYFRDYDPAVGRYRTSDPIGLQGGMNIYAYALSDPIGKKDPLGLAVYLTYHELTSTPFIDPHHLAMLLIPDDQQWALQQPAGMFTLGGSEDGIAAGMWYRTISAGPQRGIPAPPGNLVSTPNRQTDLPSINTVIGEIAAPDSIGYANSCGIPSDTTWISYLSDIDGSYANNLNYDYLSTQSEEGWNSNSYITGLLRFAGTGSLSLPTGLSFPGADKPIPDDSFTRPSGP